MIGRHIIIKKCRYTFNKEGDTAIINVVRKITGTDITVVECKASSHMRNGRPLKDQYLLAGGYEHTWGYLLCDIDIKGVKLL